MNEPARCPIEAAMAVMGGKWKPGIIYRLRLGTYRFGALRREMPWISERVLSRQLKELEADGVVSRTDHGEMPPRVDYALTPYGRTIVPLLDDVADWGRRHLALDGSRRDLRAR